MLKIQQREGLLGKEKDRGNPFLTILLNKWGHLLRSLLVRLVFQFLAQGTGSSVNRMFPSVCTTLSVSPLLSPLPAWGRADHEQVLQGLP